MSGQGNLLDYCTQCACNVDAAVKAAMRQAAKESTYSREIICDRMNEIAEAAGFRLGGGNSKALSLALLEKWLNPLEREHTPPLRALAVFCRALGTVEPLRAMANPLGAHVIDKRQALLLKRAEVDEEIRTLQRLKKKIEGDL